MPQRLDVDRVIGLASRLRIINQGSSALDLWDMNDEQIEVLEAIVENQFVCVLKGRQVGVSTAVLLYVLVTAITNPGMPCTIVADTREKAQAMLGRIAGWCKQIGITLTSENKGSITLENGAEIDALSAVSRADGGESRVGRSKSYFLIMASELAFWLADEAVFRGLTSTALPNARIIIESTASAADNLFKKLWSDEENEWHRVFLTLEKHVAYRRDPADISDEQWETLQQAKYGFTRRDTAAWWWHTMRNKFGGDEFGAHREFPVIPAHCFSFARGRWILRYVEAQTTQGGRTEKERYSGWTYYTSANIDEPVVFGVDTAAGHGGDSSALAVVGMMTGTLHATWMDHNTSLPDYIEVIKDAAEKYKPTAIVVEYNGVGIPVYEALDQFSGYHIIKQVSGAEKHYRLQRLKMAIEMGVVQVGPELVAEIKASRIEPPTGPKGQPSYEGRDDMLNAVSFAREHYMNNLPTSSPVDPSKSLDREKVFHRSQVKRRQTERF